MPEKIIVTGAAWFIGFHFAMRMLQAGRHVIGIDNVNDHYDPALKEARVALLKNFELFDFRRFDLSDRKMTASFFSEDDLGTVVHLAAQPGVRYSLINPHAYIDANVVAFLNVLEGCRHRRTPHLIFASSSSVYGMNTKLPFSVHQNVDHPVSLYAATKKANELMAHSYSHLYRLPTTGLRFFTVYGPWGRPDMATMIFAAAIAAGRPIRLFNYGKMKRDFTYIDNIVDAMEVLIDRPPSGNSAWKGDAPDPASSPAPWRVYNIGNNSSVPIERVVSLLEQELGRTAIKELVPMELGDVPETFADIDALQRDTGFQPRITIEEGIRRFAQWFREYYQTT